MDDYANSALYGDGANYAAMSADMLNGGAAADSQDWGAVLMSGIRGAAQAAVSASAGAKFQNGQLVTAASASAARANQTRTMLLIAAAVYFLVIR